MSRSGARVVVGHEEGIYRLCAVDYAERLTVPLRWWVQGTMFVATLWLAVLAATPEVFAWSVTAVAMAVLVALFVGYGRARVSVDGTTFRAGRAHIPLAPGRTGDAPSTPTAYDARRVSRPTPGPTSCCAPTSSGAYGWTSPTRPTPRRTGWSAAADRTRSSQPWRRGATEPRCWVG